MLLFIRFVFTLLIGDRYAGSTERMSPEELEEGKQWLSDSFYLIRWVFSINLAVLDAKYGSDFQILVCLVTLLLTLALVNFASEAYLVHLSYDEHMASLSVLIF